MTVETDTIKKPKESPSKMKRKRTSRSSSSESSSSATSSSSSASSRSSSSSSSNSSSSSSRSTSPESSPEKKNDRSLGRAANNKSNKKSSEHPSVDEKINSASANQTRRSPSPPRRQEKEKPATKIYIGKLSLNVNREHLAEIFGTFGEIKEIELPSHRVHPHLHRGFAHIEYNSAAAAEQACKYMEGGQVDGKEIVCVLVHGQPSHLTADRNRREPSPLRRRQRSPGPPSRYYPPRRRMGDRDRDRDRGRYNDRRGGYSPPSRNYRRGQSPPISGRRAGAGGNAAESPKKKERKYSRSSSNESK